MRLHRLDVEGFGPFRARQVVDFDALSRDGIFLIGGKTGAGKSSILDAVCFALYGGVPRYDDGEKRIRSDHSALDEPTLVRLEFTAAGSRWAVERVPTYERRKRNGRGTTITPAQARLEEWVDGAWVGRAARPVDVGHELAPILGLTQQQFLQVILLSQGRFARFLLARNDERQGLLRTLFDSQRFGGYEAALERRRKQTQEQLGLEDRTLRTQLETAERALAADPELLSPTDETRRGEAKGDAGGDAIAEAELSLSELSLSELSLSERVGVVRHGRLRAAHLRETAGAEEESARAVHRAAESAHAEAVEVRREQVRRDEAREALRSLDDRQATVEASRTRLAAATEAELLRPLLEAVDRAEATRARAGETRALELAAWMAAGESVEAGVSGGPSPGTVARETAEPDTVEQDTVERDTVQARADALLAESGALGVAADAEGRLPGLIADRDALDSALAAAETGLAALAGRRTTLPARAEEITAAISRAAERAERRPVLETRRDAAHAVVAATAEAARAAAAVETALVAAHEVGRALTRASAELDDLRERRFRDHAGELAEALVDGEPCPVCGACQHPQPTPRTDAPVTDADIAGAEETKTRARADDSRAAAALDAARDAAAAAAARAGGLTRDDALQAAHSADLELAEAVEAEAEKVSLEAERTRVLDEISAAEAEAVALIAAMQEAAKERAAVERAVSDARRTVDAARGDHPTVAARRAHVDALSRRARSVLTAIDALVASTEAADAARERLEVARAASAFADRAALEAALLPAADRDRLHAEVTEYDARRAALRETLIDLELRVLPEEPIDVEAAAAQLAAAVDARDAAVRRSSAVSRLAAQLDDAVTATEIAFDKVADLTAEAEVVERLAATVAGRAPNTLKMNLETFVLAAELEEIVDAANLRLDEMTSGRYRLRHTDARAARGAASGLGIEVFDAFTGQARPVQSLSGGETFLASLALALGLAEVVTARAGGITLDTLFIDEGFGSLDGETLDVAMRTLDELRQAGRVIGVISHVEAMKDQLPAQVTVRVGARGDSVIEQDAAPALPLPARLG